MLGVCEARGDIDLATSPAFGAVLRACIDGAESVRVVVDFGGVDFMDSSAFHALVEASEYAVAHNHVLVVRELPAAHARLISICDWDREIVIESVHDDGETRDGHA